MTIVKTKEQAQQLLTLMKDELANLPWGDADAVEEKAIIQELEIFINTGTLPADEWSEVYLWLTGHNQATIGKDYGVD